jgi:hypothetical protein
MRRFDPRLIFGVLLVFGGLLSLLDVMGIISNAGGIFWGLLWGAAGIFFLYLLFNDRTLNWWAAFPGFTFLGMAVSSVLPNALEAFDGLVFFAGISLAFWWVYFTDRTRWWAIIPAGVLLTLGIVSSLDEVSGMDTGGFFFLGLGLTFVLVAVLPGESNRSWALIPGIILLLFGTIIGIPFLGLSGYVMPAALILVGGYLVLRFFRSQST